MAFSHRGGCFSYSDPATELVSRALSWLTLGRGYNGLNLTSYPYSQANLGAKFSPALADRAFIIITGAPRNFKSYGAPTFSLSGSNVRHRVGWAVLPGPSSNRNLSRFIFMAALAAYSASRGPMAKDGTSYPYFFYLRSA